MTVADHFLIDAAEEVGEKWLAQQEGNAGEGEVVEDPLHLSNLPFNLKFHRLELRHRAEVDFNFAKRIL